MSVREEEYGPVRLEWPTWIVIVSVYAGWAAVTWYAASLPWWALLTAGTILICWHMHMQHEILHGHPTRSVFLNSLIAWPPLSIWIPYPIYRESHIHHHNAETLASPDEDPESFYLNEESWRSMPVIGKWAYKFNNALLGRFLVGPLIAVPLFWRLELRRILSGDMFRIRTWLIHLALVAVLYWYVVEVCGLPFWQYCLLFAFPGTSLALLRSYLEHKPSAIPEHRTAIVEGCHLTRLLFLNNNFHVVHHDHPSMPWYQIPKFYQSNKTHILERNGGYFYPGYRAVFRQHFFRPKDQPLYPI